MVKQKLESLKNHKNLCMRYDEMEHDRNYMQDEVQNLQQQLVDSEQHVWGTNFEIQDVPLTSGEMSMYVWNTSRELLVWTSRKKISRLRLSTTVVERHARCGPIRISQGAGSVVDCD
ncbi:hypothetical protein J6590_044072 [Homalodisca vitripennis]|nr:hypothetical protein J6590_044072 [Homalodisca vitripennis]